MHQMFHPPTHSGIEREWKLEELGPHKRKRVCMEEALKRCWYPRPFLFLLSEYHDASDLLPYAPNMMCYAATDPKHPDHVSIDWYLRNHEPKNPLLFVTSRQWTGRHACKTSVSLGYSPALPEKVLGKRKRISWHTEQNLTKDERHYLLSIT